MFRLWCWKNLVKKEPEQHTVDGKRVISFEGLRVTLTYEQAKHIANRVAAIDVAQGEKELSTVISRLPVFAVSDEALPKEGVFIKCELTCPVLAVDQEAKGKLKAVESEVSVWFL